MKKQHSLSVILITKNEADRVEKCLQSVAHVADEIIVLDSGSTDDTVAICQRYTDKVTITDWPGFGKQKQRALEQATCDWVLSIDADEALDEVMQQSMTQLLCQTDIECTSYRLPWGVTIYGKTLKYGRSARSVLRLFQREGARYTLDEVHETVVPAEGKKGKLAGLLLHYTQRHYGHGLEKTAKYAWLGAQKYHRKGKKARPFPLIVLGGGWTFILIYFIRRGFLDGAIGFIVAMSYAQANYNKHMGLWLLQNRKP
ncbi:glycosyltransferase family 2 protein [Motilimonas pumila]|uniref:Glycosyltransferase family 2 protein n=1 Tax=Motilimonas pumila TaxID=2303987 RepID=A0A418YHX6_9GAMM|nr:glycosyltransferase family 2 protein [Motilimonas pumila]RJG49549.1 glycosyltransferase family 2 protein [Motilimonas pumila]